MKIELPEKKFRYGIKSLKNHDFKKLMRNLKRKSLWRTRQIKKNKEVH